MIETISNFHQTHSKEFSRFVKFAVVGALGAIIDFGLLNLLKGGFGWHLLAAKVCSVSVAIISNFIWNRYWTYPESRTHKKRTQLPQFAAVNLIGLVINTFILVSIDALIVGYIGEPLSYNVANLFAIGVVMFWNFGVNRLWTYRGL